MSDSTNLVLHLRESEKQHSEIKTILFDQSADKYFLQIKEDYWTHIILPIFIPLLAFLIGRFYSTISDKLKKLKALKETQRYLLAWISLIHEPIERQANVYEQYATNLKELKTEQLIVLNLHLDKLKQIDSVTLVSLIVTNRIGEEAEKNAILFKFENVVDALKRKDEATKTLLADLRDLVKTTYEVWNNNYKQIQEIIQELHHVSTSLANPPQVDAILEIFADYTRTGEKGMIACMKHFVTKAGPICSNYINYHPQDAIMRKLMNSLGQLRFAYDSLYKHCNDFSTVFAESAFFMKNKYETLKEASDEIKDLKWKNLFFIR